MASDKETITFDGMSARQGINAYNRLLKQDAESLKNDELGTRNMIKSKVSARDLGMTQTDFDSAPLEELIERYQGFEAMKLSGIYSGKDLSALGMAAHNILNLPGNIYDEWKSQGLSFGDAAKHEGWNAVLSTVQAANDIGRKVSQFAKSDDLRSGLKNAWSSLKSGEIKNAWNLIGDAWRAGKNDIAFDREVIVPLKSKVGANGLRYFTGERDFRNSSYYDAARGLAFSMQNPGGAGLPIEERAAFGLTDWLLGNIDGDYTHVLHGDSGDNGRFSDSNKQKKLDGHTGNFIMASTFPGTGHLKYATAEDRAEAERVGWNMNSVYPITEFDPIALGKSYKFSAPYLKYVTDVKGGKVAGFSSITTNGGDELTGNSMAFNPETMTVTSTDHYNFGKDVSGTNWRGLKGSLTDHAYTTAHLFAGNGNKQLGSRKYTVSGTKPQMDDIISISQEIRIDPNSDLSPEDQFYALTSQIYGEGKNARDAAKKAADHWSHFNSYTGSKSSGDVAEQNPLFKLIKTVTLRGDNKGNGELSTTALPSKNTQSTWKGNILSLGLNLWQLLGNTYSGAKKLIGNYLQYIQG